MRPVNIAVTDTKQDSIVHNKDRNENLPRLRISDLTQGAALMLMAPAAVAMTTAEFKKQYFEACPKSDGVMVLKNPMTVEDLEKLSAQVSRTSSGNSDFNWRNFKDTRVARNGPYFQYRNHEDQTEPPMSQALFSINGAMIKARKLGVEVEIPVAGGKPELAKQIYDLMLDKNMKVLGIRPFDFAEGGFTVFYADKSTNKVMATILYTKTKPDVNNSKSVKDQADVMHRALIPVLKHTWK